MRKIEIPPASSRWVRVGSTRACLRASRPDVADVLAGDAGVAAGFAFVTDLAAGLRDGVRAAGQAGRVARR